MNLLSKKTLISLFALLLCGSAFADTTLPARVEAFFPDVLLQRLVYESDINDLVKRGDWGQTKQSKNKKHWIAFSDRSNNTTYSSPSVGTPFSKLNFNEKVIIAKIENGFALVYTDPKYTQWPAYSEKAESKGWIPMENLLLWQSCPADTKGIYQKALLAANIESKANRNLGKSYKNPVEKSDGQRIKTDMTFYYVMKTDAKTGLKLLANQARLDGNTSNVLYGWVDENSFVPWNQRSCLEPNWKPSDVSYFNSPAGKPYPIYPDAAMKEAPATYYQYGVQNPEDNKASSKYRMNAYQTRFPILDQDVATANPNIYKCTTFGAAGRITTTPINIDPDKDPEILAKKKLNETLNKIKHVNIIFVIDGTKSMKPYFASVKEAINRGLQYFDPNKFTLRVGAVIYRDYADGEFLTEKVPLGKSTSPQLLSFLDNAGKYGATSSPNDHTNAEALYKGLEVATDPAAMGFSKDESTIILVVGDCGNDPADTKCMTSDQIVDRLAKNNIQLLSFQVDSRPSMAWELFNEQMCDLVKKSLTKQYQRLKPDVTTKFKSLKNGYDFSSNSGVEFFIGSIRFPENEGPINTSVLAKLIEDNIGKFSEAVQQQIEILINGTENIASGNDDSGFVGDKDVNEKQLGIADRFLIDRIGKELYDELKKSGATVTFTGYAPKKDTQNRDYWKPVVFMSREELEALMSNLGRLYNNARAEGDRKPYVDAVKALIRVMVPDVTEKEMDEMGISEVMRLAAGLNESSDAVKGRSLSEIQDARVVPNDEYQTLINTFINKYEGLRDNVYNKTYKYSYDTPNGQKFYWIPVEDLP